MSYQRVMFVSAHPDDEVAGAGGTLLKFKSLGAELMLVLAIDPGEEKLGHGMEEERSIRLREFRSVAVQLGALSEFVGLSHYPQLTQVLVKPFVKLIRSFQPQVVMILSEGDYHTEHGCVAKIVKRAAWHARRDAFTDCGELHRVEEIWEAEGDRPMHEINYLEDVSDFMERKLELFSLYSSQLKNKDLADAVCGINRFRGVMYKKGRYAEAFYRSHLIYG